jgi:hypothetical protein
MPKKLTALAHADLLGRELRHRYVDVAAEQTKHQQREHIAPRDSHALEHVLKDPDLD